MAVGAVRANRLHDQADEHVGELLLAAVSDQTEPDRGIQSSYSEPGAPLLVSAYSSSGGRPGITTTDRTGSAGYSNNDYTNTFGGTSSATPLVSGYSGNPPASSRTSPRTR